mmetsp:Transcript_38087/g.98351  ORF Transcript_38087/g.98351 Transcript_38087/m.98351 type:complete len:91 (-) Transcript_38087:925-1197(-)
MRTYLILPLPFLSLHLNLNAYVNGVYQLPFLLYIYAYVCAFVCVCVCALFSMNVFKMSKKQIDSQENPLVDDGCHCSQAPFSRIRGCQIC